MTVLGGRRTFGLTFSFAVDKFAQREPHFFGRGSGAGFFQFARFKSLDCLGDIFLQRFESGELEIAEIEF